MVYLLGSIGVALLVANLMVSVRRQTAAAAARERQTALLYGMSRELTAAHDTAAIAAVTTKHVSAALDADVVVLLAGEEEQLRVVSSSAPEAAQCVDQRAARRLLESYQGAGSTAQPLPDSPVLHVPLCNGEQAIGVLVLDPHDGLKLSAQHKQLLETFVGQTALAFERARLAEVAAASRAAAERAALRSTLLAAVSHDLRAPLSAIAGAGSLVAQSHDPLDWHRRKTLGQLIEEKARDVSGLLSNVLELVRLETAAVPIKADWHSLEELVGTAVRCNENRLGAWRISTAIARDLPLLLLDAQLVVQLLSNLLENAAKHTPPGTSIAIAAAVVEGKVLLTVEDDGPGFGAGDPERLFEMFERGHEENHVKGLGVGLAICRAVARLHGGEIKARNRPGGGARFEIRLPMAAAAQGQAREHG